MLLKTKCEAYFRSLEVTRCSTRERLVDTEMYKCCETTRGGNVYRLENFA